MEFTLSQLYVPRTLRYSQHNPISTHKQLDLHVQICRCQIQGMSSNTQEPTKKILVHVVKQGETLNSISKLYGVPICDIAAVNEEVADVDLVFEGKQLNIPSSLTAQVPKYEQDRYKKELERPILSYPNCWGERETTPSPESSSARASGVGLYSRFHNMNSPVTSFHHLSYAKSTGYFLVLVPLIAFCIRCILGALNNRHARDLDHNSASESERCHHRTKRMRWKNALLDLRDPDESDTNPRPEFFHFTEDEDQMDANDVSYTCSKLEEEYQKFLSECGVSKWGYWRGGSSE